MFRRGSRGGRSRGGMRVYRSYPLYREEDTEDYDRYDREMRKNTILMTNIAVAVDLLAISDTNKNQFLK